jgi:hypothetical protein
MNSLEQAMADFMTLALKMTYRNEAPLQLFCRNCQKNYSRQEYWKKYIQPLIDQAESLSGHPLAYIDDSSEIFFATCERCEFGSFWGEEE